MAIEVNDDTKAKIVAVGKALLGSCSSEDQVIQETFGDEELILTDLPMELLQMLDDITMRCDECGWWCETGFLNDDQVCDQCEPSEDDDEEE
jgi:hypothetical protein